MGIFQYFRKTNNATSETPLEVHVDNPMQSFSTPFGKIGDGNLSLPYVRAYGSEPWVRFGNDNLYPQLINQIYYQSPLNGSIVNYKVNAVIGGGWEINSVNPTAKDKVDEYTFIKVNKMKKLVRQITKDLIMHGRICILVNESNGKVKLTRVGPEKVRNNEMKTLFTLSDDWARSVNIRSIRPHTPGCKGESMYYFEIDSDAGQDIYPIPAYSSAMNSAFLDGEMSYLQKSNIVNSIFPSFMVKLAKSFGSEDEAQQFRDTINKAKGAPAAGRIMTFIANTPEQLPSIEAIPMNGNDKVFDSTLMRVDANICRAHQIDPLLMGIRVTGGIGGQGNELQVSYTIFEKNVVMPLRDMLTECVDELFSIGNLTSTIEINNYQIISEVIVDVTDKKI